MGKRNKIISFLKNHKITVSKKTWFYINKSNFISLFKSFKSSFNNNTVIWEAGIHGGKVLSGLKNQYPEAISNFMGFIDSLKERQRLKVIGYSVYSPKDEIIKKADLMIITSYSFEKDIKYTAKTLKINIPVLGLYSDIFKEIGVSHSIF